MNIRKLDRSEHAKTRGLYEEVFAEDSKAFVDYYYTEKTKDNQIYVVEEDGGIQAMFHLNPYCVIVNGEKRDLHYIVAVATRKAYRSRGYMAALMKRALEDMYENGELFTYLMPAAEEIYLPHDFRTVYEQDIRYYDKETILELGVTVQKAQKEDCQELADWANQRISASYQIYAFRTQDYYERILKETACEHGGLMIYRKEGQIIDCRMYYGEDSDDNSEDKPKIMTRIVDVRRMLMSIKLKGFIGTCFQITDPIIRQNNRTVMITGTEYSGVMLMDVEPERREGVVTIAALSSFLFGAKTVEEISAEDGVIMSDTMKQAFLEMIPLNHIYLNEVV